MYRSFLFTLLALAVITHLTMAQEEDSLDGAAEPVSGPTDVDAKLSDTNAGDSGAEEAKPKTDKQRKTTYKEERFEKLFSNRSRKPRLPPPKYNLKPKPTLPSYFKSAPNIKPLAESDEPTVRPSNTNKPKKVPGRVTSFHATSSTTTTTVSPLSSRNKNLRSSGSSPSSSSSSSSFSKHSDQAKNSHNESTESSRKRFSSSRGRNNLSRSRSSGTN